MKTLFQVDDHVRVVQMTSPEEGDTLLTVLEQIAREFAWPLGNALRQAQSGAQHFALTLDGAVIGGLQAVPGSLRPSPHQAVWPDVAVADPHRTLHVTLMALLPQYRGRAFLFWPLCVELWRYCIAEGFEAILLETTPATLRFYRRIGWPLEEIGDLRPHWEEECLLCRMDVQEAGAIVCRKAGRTASYQALVQQGYRTVEEAGAGE